MHARIFGSFSGVLLEDLLTELAPLTEHDVIVTNFGAWYPRFVKQVGKTQDEATFKGSLWPHHLQIDASMATLHAALQSPDSDSLQSTGWRGGCEQHIQEI